jgi:hypothetical protein
MKLVFGTVDASCLTGLTSTTLTNGTVVTQKGVPTSNGTLLSNASFTVPNTAEPSQAVWAYAVSVQSDATQTTAALGYVCTNPVSSGTVNVKVTTPLGLITAQAFPITD